MNCVCYYFLNLIFLIKIDGLEQHLMEVDQGPSTHPSILPLLDNNQTIKVTDNTMELCIDGLDRHTADGKLDGSLTPPIGKSS